MKTSTHLTKDLTEQNVPFYYSALHLHNLETTISYLKNPPIQPDQFPDHNLSIKQNTANRQFTSCDISLVTANSFLSASPKLLPEKKKAKE